METTRQIRKPRRYGEWEEDVKLPTEKVKEKLWEVEDILLRKGSGDDEEVLVKWANWQGPPTWVALSYNTELKAFLTKNRGNPYSSTLVRTELGNPTAETKTDLYALRQAIFDVLSEVRYTPEGSVGRQTRVSVKVPFRREEFQDTFGKIMNNKTGATGNNECFLTLEDMNVVFGDDRWSRRQYTTSTETFISSKEFIHISWGYKERLNYNHTQCKRCHWEGEEEQRPELCDPLSTNLLGPPWLQLTFTRGRRNMVTGDMSRKRKTHRK